MAITKKGKAIQAQRKAAIAEYNFKSAYVMKSYNAEYDRRGFSAKRPPSMRTQDQMFNRAVARSNRAYAAHVKAGPSTQLSAAQLNQRRRAARSPRRGRTAAGLRSGSRVS